MRLPSNDVKRALAAFAFGLAACSSGGGAGEFATQDAAVTATTRDPAEAFAVQLDIKLNGETPEDREQAVEVARAMCDLLDSTTTGLGEDDAANDNAVTDAAISATLTDAALDMVNDSGLPPDISAVVLRTGAEHFCPEHSGLVDTYLENQG